MHVSYTQTIGITHTANAESSGLVSNAHQGRCKVRRMHPRTHARTHAHTHVRTDAQDGTASQESMSFPFLATQGYLKLIGVPHNVINMHVPTFLHPHHCVTGSAVH